MLTGSAVELTRETRRGGTLSFWSRGAQSQFTGREGARRPGPHDDGRRRLCDGAAGGGPVAVAQPGTRRLRRRRHRRGDLVGDGPLSLALGYQATDWISLWAWATARAP